jgi:hypothetical protein
VLIFQQSRENAASLRDDGFDDRQTEIRGSPRRLPDNPVLRQAWIIGPPWKAGPAVKDHVCDRCAIHGAAGGGDHLTTHELRCNGEHHGGLGLPTVDVHRPA